MDAATRSRSLSQGWRIGADTPARPGPEVAMPGFDDRDWVPTRVPATVLASLTAAGEYTDLFRGDNLSRVDRERFEGPWWYRTEFELESSDVARFVSLHLDGINYRAELWLNGRKVDNGEPIVGAYRRFRIAISSLAFEGANALALRVHPPRPGDFSTGFVDWNPAPPDGNMGVFRPVSLRVHGPVSIHDPFVTTKLDTDGGGAALTVRATVVNDSNEPVRGMLKAELLGLSLEHPFDLQGGTRSELALTSDRFPSLRVDNPPLWWPHTLGEPVLHALDLTAHVEEEVSDRVQSRFGIREIEDYFTAEGHRGFRVNGRELLILGAGWTDDLFLADTGEKIEAQIRYVKHMGLNSIRLEGIWGSDHTLYDLCDVHGVLVMVGWSCHWEHEQYLGREADGKYGGILSERDVELVARSWEDQVMWLRHHPSIFVWAVGSDKMPAPELERRYIDTFRRCDLTRPYLISTAGYGSDEGVITHDLIESEISGASGMKMLGPYDYTPPAYWYSDTRRGGAYGFNTETGPGAQPPVLESILRMIPEEHHWPVDAVWEYHCARNEFDRLERFLVAMTRRLGQPSSLEDFDMKAQVLNYELMRPMFEAFRVHRGSATGVIQWMLNAAWPKLYWQLYDYYLVPNAAFYATRKALRPVHLAFDYADRRVWLVHNESRAPAGLRATARLLDMRGQEIWRDAGELPARDGVRVAFTEIPEPAPEPAGILDLRLRTGQGDEIDQSVYWLSSTPDVLDYETPVKPWPFYTPSSGYADYAALNDLDRVELESAWCIQLRDGRHQLTATMRNRSKVPAFFVEVRLLDGETGLRQVPILWDDNYITLMPGEIRTLTASFDRRPPRAVVEIAGWNVKTFEPEP